MSPHESVASPSGVPADPVDAGWCAAPALVLSLLVVAGLPALRRSFGLPGWPGSDP